MTNNKKQSLFYFLSLFLLITFLLFLFLDSYNLNVKRIFIFLYPVILFFCIPLLFFYTSISKTSIYLFLSFFLLLFSVILIIALINFHQESQIGYVAPQLILEEIISVKYYYLFNNIFYFIWYIVLGWYFNKRKMEIKYFNGIYSTSIVLVLVSIGAETYMIFFSRFFI